MSAMLDWDRDGQDWPHRETSRFVQAGGLYWHVQTSGEGPVVLLLHGTGASSHSWRALVPILNQRFTVVVPDLPGHGFTTSPAPSQLSLPSMARQVVALLTRLDCRPEIIAAHSAGVAIALRMCLNGSVSPRTIVSINGALIPFGGIASYLFPMMARMVAFNPFVQGFVAARANDRAAVERLILGTGSRIDPIGLELYRRLFRCKSHVAATLGMMANWDLHGLKRELPKLTQDVTLIVAEADKAVPPEDARVIRKLIPQAHVISMRGVGHLCHEERPNEVSAMIADAYDKNAIPEAQKDRWSQSQ